MYFETIAVYRSDSTDNGQELLRKVDGEIAALIQEGRAPMQVIPIQTGGSTTAILIVTAKMHPPGEPPSR